MTRVSIHCLELTPLECEVLSEIMAAKLEQHIADRARYIRKDSGAGPILPVEDVDAGNPRPAKPAFSTQRIFAAGAPQPPRGEVAPDMLDGLRAMIEGGYAAQQPRRFVRIMFHASMAGYVETRGAALYLTEAGKAAIQ